MVQLIDVLGPSNDLKDFELACENGLKYIITKYKSLKCKFKSEFFYCYKESVCLHYTTWNTLMKLTFFQFNLFNELLLMSNAIYLKRYLPIKVGLLPSKKN